MLDRVTFGITAFNRPDHLRRLGASIRHQYPAVQIHIADNGSQPAADLTEFPGVQYTQLPFDCGLSASRNYLADQLATEFLLLLDDDFIFDEQTRIEDLVAVLDADPEVGLVGGEVRSHVVESFPGFLTENVLVRRATPPVHHFAGNVRYQRCEFVWNFALIRRTLLHDIRWDARLKLAEHTDVAGANTREPDGRSDGQTPLRTIHTPQDAASSGPHERTGLPP